MAILNACSISYLATIVVSATIQLLRSLGSSCLRPLSVSRRCLSAPLFFAASNKLLSGKF